MGQKLYDCNIRSGESSLLQTTGQHTVKTGNYVFTYGHVVDREWFKNLEKCSQYWSSSELVTLELEQYFMYNYLHHDITCISIQKIVRLPIHFPMERGQVDSGPQVRLMNQKYDY